MIKREIATVWEHASQRRAKPNTCYSRFQEEVSMLSSWCNLLLLIVRNLFKSITSSIKLSSACIIHRDLRVAYFDLKTLMKGFDPLQMLITNIYIYIYMKSSFPKRDKRQIKKKWVRHAILLCTEPIHCSINVSCQIAIFPCLKCTARCSTFLAQIIEWSFIVAMQLKAHLCNNHTV